jgi:hypothetical protein
METRLDQQETRRDRLFQPNEGNLVNSTAQRFSSSISNPQSSIVNEMGGGVNIYSYARKKSGSRNKLSSNIDKVKHGIRP